MTLHRQISQRLAELKGFAPQEPTTVAMTGDRGVLLEIDFTGVDSLSCSFRELRLIVPERCEAPEALKVWADRLCQKVIYLLERIGPLEFDATAQTVLVRSTPPEKNAARTSYYEVLVKAPGVVTLARFSREAPESDRRRVDLLVTHEVLLRLIHDLVESVPETA